MSLDHAILGFLSYRPMSGYDLKKCFDDSVRNFWPATQSQIYRTLKRLVDEGLARVEVVEQDGPPDRKVHHLTPAGASALRAWLSQPAPESGGRSAGLVQLFFADQLDNQAIAELLARRRAAIAARLDYLRDEVQPVIPRRGVEFGSERKRRLWQMTLESGLAHLATELAWIDACLVEVAQLPAE
jgi:DNA-binding PadR family transcriptional regulator